MHERGAAERRDGFLVEPEHPGGVGGELRAAAAVPAHVRRLEVDEVGGDGERVVELVAVEHAVRLGLEGEHGVPRLGLAEPVEPAASVRDEQVGERRVVGAVAAIARGLERVGRARTRRPIASMSWLRCTTRIGERDRLALARGWDSRSRSSART